MCSEVVVSHKEFRETLIKLAVVVGLLDRRAWLPDFLYQLDC